MTIREDGLVTIPGNLSVTGTTTTVNTTNLTVDDKNIYLANNNTNDTTASGGGIILKGASDKSITWSDNTWTSNQNFTVESTGNTDLKITNSGTLRARLFLNTVNDEANDLFFNQNNSIHWSLSGRSSTEAYALRFYTRNSSWDTVMALQKDGNVGINKTDPTSKLHINGGNTGTGVIDLHVQNSNNAVVCIEDTDSYNQAILRYKVGGNVNWTTGIHGAGSSGASKFKISNNDTLGTNDYFVINGSGNIGIGTDNPANGSKLHIRDGYLLIGQDVDNAVNKGGAIQFETADDTNDYGANVIGARTYAGGGYNERTEMMFFVGNNDDTSGYGPDRFCFVGPEFRIYNNNLTPPAGTHGKAVLDNVAGQIASQVPSFIINSDRTMLELEQLIQELN